MTSSLCERVRPFHEALCATLGAVLRHTGLQLVVFPLLAVRLRAAEYGEMQYLLLLVDLLAASLGTALGISRMLAPNGERHRNGDGHSVLLLALSALAPFALFLARFGGYCDNIAMALSYVALFCAVAWRRYAEVSFRLALHYSRFFLFCAVIGVGYVVGLALFYRSGAWPLALLLGELCGLLFAYATEIGYKRQPLARPALFSAVFRTVPMLFLWEAASRLALGADELLVGVIGGPLALGTYHLAALMGRAQLLAAAPLWGVLLGSLTSRSRAASIRALRWIFALSFLGILPLALTGMLGTWGVVRLFYPAYLENVAHFLLPVNLAKAACLATNALTVCIFRFLGARAVIVLRLSSAVVSLALGIPSLVCGGLEAFAWMVMLSVLLRFLMTASLFWKLVKEFV